MSASNFANIIISKLDSYIGTDGSKYNSETPKIANLAISEGITEYLLENTTISISYTGTIVSPPAPFTTIDSCKITGSCAPPSGTDFNTWIKSLENNITSGFLISSGKLVIPTTPSLAFIPGLVILQDTIRKVHLDNLRNPQNAVWEIICQSILDWLNKIVSLPYPAETITPLSTGISTITKIIVL